MPDPIEAREVFKDGDNCGSGTVTADVSDPLEVGLHVEGPGGRFASAYLNPLAAARLAERLLQTADEAIPTEGGGE